MDAAARAARHALAALPTLDLDFETVQRRSAEAIRSAVPFTVAVAGAVDPAVLLETSCVTIDFERDPVREQRVMQLEYAGDDPLTFAEVAARPARAVALGLEVDDPSDVRRFAEIYGPAGAIDELRATFVVDGQCWGTLALYRAADMPTFTPGDVAFCTGISALMADSLRRAFLRAAVDRPDRLVDPPGHLLVGRRGDIITTTEAAERWLDTLGSQDGPPPVLAALVARLEEDPSPRATVVGAAGPVTLHAARAKGLDDAVAVVIERPRPIQLTPLVVAAYGLTPREREVAELVSRGLVTSRIGRELGISDHTVQDHLKAIFAKVGVAGRGELTYALFTRHYLPAVHAHATPGPYGYFLDAEHVPSPAAHRDRV